MPRTGRLEDLEEAIRCYRHACGLGAIVAPQETLNASRNWGRWALRRASWLEVEEAYSQGLAAGRALQRRQLRRSDKESYLGEMQEMAPAAAYAIARAGGSPARAARTLELGRAQLLGEALQLNRRDLDNLPAELKAAFDRALAERRRLEQPDAAIQGSRLAAIEAADRAFESVVAAIRQVAGFADFLADPTFDQILAAAQSGPLVYLLATEAGGLALIVHGEAASTHLPGSSETSRMVPTPSRRCGWTTCPRHGDGSRSRGRPDDPALGGWLGAYQDWLNRARQPRTQHWLATMDGVLHGSSDAAWGCCRRAGAGRRGAWRAGHVDPSGLLARLPLHTAWTADVAALPQHGSASAHAVTDRIYGIDCFALAYAPCARRLRHAQTVANQKPTFSETTGRLAAAFLAAG